MEISLTTITPIHIGSGRKYSATEFLVKGKELYKVDINKVFLKLDEKTRAEFVTRLEDPNFQLGSFLQGMNIPLSEIKLYSCNLKTDLKTGLPNEINEYIKTHGGAFIPGSSIKGSIRTAILYNLIDEKDIYKIDRIFDLGYRQRDRDREIQTFIDGFFVGETNRQPSSYSSFLRFLQITDTETTNNLSVYSIKALRCERRGWSWYKRHGRDVTLFSEVIDAGKNLRAEVSEHYDPDIYKKLGLRKKERYIDMANIKEFIYNFSADLIEHEIEFSEKYHIDFLSDFYKQVKSKNTKDSPLLKLGHGSGFLATTIGLKLKKHPQVFEKVRKGLRGKSYPYEFPKTRKIVVEENTPLGWVKLKF